MILLHLIQRIWTATSYVFFLCTGYHPHNDPQLEKYLINSTEQLVEDSYLPMACNKIILLGASIVKFPGYMGREFPMGEGKSMQDNEAQQELQYLRILVEKQERIVTAILAFATVVLAIAVFIVRKLMSRERRRTRLKKAFEKELLHELNNQKQKLSHITSKYYEIAKKLGHPWNH